MHACCMQARSNTIAIQQQQERCHKAEGCFCVGRMKLSKLYKDFVDACRDFTSSEPEEEGEVLRKKLKQQQSSTSNSSSKQEVNIPSTKQWSILIRETAANPSFAVNYSKVLIQSSNNSSEKEKHNEQSEQHPQILSVDCEMIETSEEKMALARISVVELDSRSGGWVTCLDVVVKPVNEIDYIVDARTEITGLHAKDIIENGLPLEKARIMFKQCVDSDASTILIGHSLDSDLNALRYFSNANIIDTALLFQAGNDGGGFAAPNTKRQHSLDYLCQVVLGRNTLRGDASRGGAHDSVEDATLAGEIARAIASKAEETAFPIPLTKFSYQRNSLIKNLIKNPFQKPV